MRNGSLWVVLLTSALGLSVWLGRAESQARERRPVKSRVSVRFSDDANGSERLPVSTPLPDELKAGVIPRATLQAVLASGIGRFLQQVRAEPALSRGRFVGWRLLALFPNRSDVRVQVLRPGDTVTRVNGRPIERPEQFKQVWDSLASANELVLDIERDGRPNRLRYTIDP